MTAVGTAWRGEYLTRGYFTIYALSKPDQIVTWISEEASPRTSVPMKWLPSAKQLEYNGPAIAALAGERSGPQKVYVGTEKLLQVTQYEQLGSREWRWLNKMDLS